MDPPEGRSEATGEVVPEGRSEATGEVVPEGRSEATEEVVSDRILTIPNALSVLRL
ncbi:MAG: hypothetical protein QOE74_5031, partial [Mycobacterium sp.]|nr:hypothetical protein [Mycobacterium sp.]